jgi:hypothetical protein
MAKIKTKKPKAKRKAKGTAVVTSYWWKIDKSKIHPWWRFPIGSPEFSIPSNPNER